MIINAGSLCRRKLFKNLGYLETSSSLGTRQTIGSRHGILENLRNTNETSARNYMHAQVANLLACVDGGMRERASGGGDAIFLANRVHGFTTKTNALAHEIPPATQARSYLQTLCFLL